MPTIPTQMRLTDDDKQMLDRIREEKKLPDRTSATRYALLCCVATIEKRKKKRGKISERA